MEDLDSIEVLSAMYCQGLDCGPFLMLGGWLRGRQPNAATSWPQLQGHHVLVTHQARTGIAFALRHWGIGSGDEVLVPAYNCGTDIDPVFKSGASVRAYRIGADLRLDLDDIRRLCTERTRLIYVIHYFGWPQDLAELRRYCDGKGILLLEDCALALFSRGPEGWLGHQGDGAVFSLPKTLAVPDGGILMLRESKIAAPEMSPPMRKIASKVLPLSKRFLFRRTAKLGLYRLLDPRSRQTIKDSPIADCNARPDVPSSYYFNPTTTDWGMSRITRGLLRHVDSLNIIESRRRNYMRLLAMLQGLPGIRPVYYDLPAGVCPIGLPVFVQDRAIWERQLLVRHIDVYAWWSGYHQGIEWDRFPEACELKDHVLLLPIHQQLEDWHVDYIGEQVAAIAMARVSHDLERRKPALGAVKQVHAA